MIQVRASQIESAEALAAALKARCAALADHQMGEPDQPAPAGHELLDALILRIPDSGPVEDRAPDRFEIAPYEIVDDRPIPPPAPTLAERKQALHVELHTAAQIALDKVLSPARARLLSVEYGDAKQKPKNKRNAADKATIARLEAYNERSQAILRVVARAAVAIDDLTDKTINGWIAPTFD